MEEITKVQIDLPKDFSLQLDRMIIDLKEVGIQTSKAKLIIKFAMIGYLKEKRECEKIVENFHEKG